MDESISWKDGCDFCGSFDLSYMLSLLHGIPICNKCVIFETHKDCTSPDPDKNYCDNCRCYGGFHWEGKYLCRECVKNQTNGSIRKRE